VTALLIDSSVLVKWVHRAGESEVDEAQALRAAHISGDIEARIIDLALYEVGNVLLRALKWAPGDVADQLDDLVTICGPPLVVTAEWLRLASRLADLHNLSFYDGSWAAAAAALKVPLVTADRRLLAAGLGESATDTVHRLRLLP
jgi:predicted nucleic acid-binding protein